jgi:hypothetical protein
MTFTGFPLPSAQGLKTNRTFYRLFREIAKIKLDSLCSLVTRFIKKLERFNEGPITEILLCLFRIPVAVETIKK